MRACIEPPIMRVMPAFTAIWLFFVNLAKTEMLSYSVTLRETAIRSYWIVILNVGYRITWQHDNYASVSRNSFYRDVSIKLE